MPINSIVGFDALTVLDEALWRSYKTTSEKDGHTSPRYDEFFYLWNNFLNRWSYSKIYLRRMWYDTEGESLYVMVPDSDDTSLAYCVCLQKVPKSRGGWTDKSRQEWGVTVYDGLPSAEEAVFKTRIREEDILREDENE